MDAKEYFQDLRQTEAGLMKKNKSNLVYVTYVKNREKNSTAGSTMSADAYNTALVITDGTHRIATSEEIRGFIDLQERNRVTAIKAEQRKRQQLVVLTDDRQPSESLVSSMSVSEYMGSQLAGPDDPDKDPDDEDDDDKNVSTATPGKAQ